ncbi:MAG: S-layer homology domain-containing protein [Firmicutes bacterium]|nr:S-layer homology domain-containing protein [Bacillota bacterium]
MGLETKKDEVRIRLLVLALSLILALGVIPVRNVSAASVSSMKCAAGVLIDAETGEVLWGKNPDTLMVPASMTKLMTAFVVLEAIRNGEYTMDSVVHVSSSTASFSRSGTWSNVPLSSSATYTVRQLMEAMMVESACAAAKALAEFTSGSESAFATRMNLTASKLRMSAVFRDSYGGSASNLVTPNSMAILGRAILLYHPEITDFTREQSFYFAGTTYYSTNRFIRKVYSLEDPNAVVDGLKTGTTSAAGRCLCSTATLNGRRVIAVMMKESSVANLYTDSSNALSFGLQYAQYYNPSDMVARFCDVDRTKWFAPAIQTMVDTGLMTGTSEYYFLPDFTLTRAQVCQILYNYADRPYMADVNSFKDVNVYAWFAPAIAWCKKTGMVQGGGNGEFGPDDPISREEMITMVFRYLQSTGVARASSDTTVLDSYSDSSQIADYAQESLNWAVSGGYITGIGDGVLSPSTFTTRAQMAQIMTRIVS